MFDYNFDLETELKIYRKVGNKNGLCNYSEWEKFFALFKEKSKSDCK